MHTYTRTNAHARTKKNPHRENASRKILKKSWINDWLIEFTLNVYKRPMRYLVFPTHNDLREHAKSKIFENLPLNLIYLSNGIVLGDASCPTIGVKKNCTKCNVSKTRMVDDKRGKKITCTTRKESTPCLLFSYGSIAPVCRHNFLTNDPRGRWRKIIG